MKLEQHIYTSGKTEFTTIAVTSGIGRSERIKLENYSQYVLPGALLYKDGITTPLKHVYYPLDEKRFVLGRAVYAGKDSLGRPGNYFFHNFIVSRDDLMKLHLDPLRLMKWLDDNKLFRNTIPEKPLEVMELPANEIKIPGLAAYALPKELIFSLLHFCSNYESIGKPLLLVGSDKGCLDFLVWLHAILPFEIRDKVSFDTYSYGTNLDFRIKGK